MWEGLSSQDFCSLLCVAIASWILRISWSQTSWRSVCGTCHATIFSLQGQMSFSPSLCEPPHVYKHWRVWSHVFWRDPLVLRWTEASGSPWCVAEAASMIMVIPSPLYPTVNSSYMTPSSLSQQLHLAVLLGWWWWWWWIFAAVMQRKWRQSICAERAQCVYGFLLSSAVWSQCRTAIFVGHCVGAGEEAISHLSLYYGYIGG